MVVHVHVFVLSILDPFFEICEVVDVFHHDGLQQRAERAFHGRGLVAGKAQEIGDRAEQPAEVLAATQGSGHRGRKPVILALEGFQCRHA